MLWFRKLQKCAGPQQRDWTEPTSQLLPTPPLRPWRVVWMEDNRYQFPLGSPDTLVPSPHQKLASRSELRGHGRQQRAAVSPRGVEVAGGREWGKHQPQEEPGIASSVGSRPAAPGSRPLSSPRTLPRPPGLSNRGGHTGLHLQAQGSGEEIFRVSLAEGIKYRTGRHSCQAEAGGAVNRTVLFAVTMPLGSLMCMCQGFWADSLTLVVTSELRDCLHFTCEESGV